MQQSYQPNSKYKTQLCKHWMQIYQGGTCHLSQRCHFAHGPEDLQKGDFDVLLNYIPYTYYKQEQQVEKDDNGARYQPRNFKTQLCRFFSGGYCKFEADCTFAHGLNELRQKFNFGMQSQQVIHTLLTFIHCQLPQMQMPNLMQNMYFNNMFVGPQMYNQMTMMKPTSFLDQQTIVKLQYILPKLVEFHKDDKEHKQILLQAADCLRKQDINNTAEQLNVSEMELLMIMHRDQMTVEEQEFYTSLVVEANDQVQALIEKNNQFQPQTVEQITKQNPQLIQSNQDQQLEEQQPETQNVNQKPITTSFVQQNDSNNQVLSQVPNQTAEDTNQEQNQQC